MPEPAQPAGDPCLHLAVWVLACWLLLMPCTLVALGEAAARRRFALTLPAGTLPPGERAAWAAWALPPPCVALAVGVLPLSLVLWRLAGLALEAASAGANQ